MMGGREKGVSLLELVIVMGVLCFIMVLMFGLLSEPGQDHGPSAPSISVQPVKSDSASQDHF